MWLVFSRVRLGKAESNYKILCWKHRGKAESNYKILCWKHRWADFPTRLRLAFFFFFWVDKHVMWLSSGSMHCSWDPQTYFFNKNGSHGIIYTFKNYFATVFLVFNFQQNKWYPNGLLSLLIESVHSQEFNLMYLYKGMSALVTTKCFSLVYDFIFIVFFYVPERNLKGLENVCSNVVLYPCGYLLRERKRGRERERRDNNSLKALSNIGRKASC